VLATQVDHTAAALRSVALRRGSRLRALAPGLLELRGDDLDAFLAEAREELSSVEADEVRCVVVDREVPDRALLAQAMTAPTLTAAGARVQHADLLPLFDDESAAFHCVYQPIVELCSGRAIGHEALLRAVDPAGTPVFPDVLFPAAQQAGWTHVLDRIGRTTALHDAGPWLGDDLLFINFVPTSIYRPEVCLRTTEKAAEAAGLDLGQLVFEVTEGHRVQDVDHLAAVFAHYRRRGCRVALDDLGAGYSSLNMLVRLQPDFVKLDKEIVQALPDPVSSAVVAAIVSITHAYGGTVLAECLETQEQADAARELGVDLGQGWLYGRPVRPDLPREARRRSSVVRSRPDPAVALEPDDVAPEPALDDLLTRAVASSASGVVVVDMTAEDMPVVHVNPAFERMSGYSAAEVVGRNCRLLQGPETDRAVVARIAQALREGNEHTCVVRNHRRDGSGWWNELHLSPVRDAAGRLTHYLGFQHDVTARVAAERELQRLSSTDGLTGLANRSTLLEQLDVAVAAGSLAGRCVAVVFVDLDGFKAVNDRAGHLVGDRVLAEVGARLRAVLRGSDLLARHGGDEFVAVLPDLDPLDAERVALRAAGDLLAALDRPVPAGQDLALVGASAGVALLLHHGTTGEELLEAADAAMYLAKAVGPGTVRLAEDARRGGAVAAPPLVRAVRTTPAG
jgi:diguanylate cyclase (GGDEF)-like protein/PAS domain S-box-containing protein